MGRSFTEKAVPSKTGSFQAPSANVKSSPKRTKIGASPIAGGVEPVESFTPIARIKKGGAPQGRRFFGCDAHSRTRLLNSPHNPAQRLRGEKEPQQNECTVT